MKLCEQCLAEFNGHGNRRYCSQECYTEAGRTRNRDKYVPVEEERRKYHKWHRSQGRMEYEVWYNYGLYLEEYQATLALGCAICGVEATDLDHDHETGLFRAVLCKYCNTDLRA